MEKSFRYIDYKAYVSYLRKVADELVDEDAIRKRFMSKLLSLRRKNGRR